MEIKKIENKVWLPVRTKPQSEKKLEEYCKAYNVKTYLPLLKKVTRYSRSTNTTFKPMFPGYIFCCLDIDGTDYRNIVRSNKILFKIDITEGEEVELIEQLNSLQIISKISKKAKIIVKPELQIGTKVLITKGPFQGIEGIIDKRKGESTVAVNLELLGQTVITEVDIEDTEKDD